MPAGSRSGLDDLNINVTAAMNRRLVDRIARDGRRRWTLEGAVVFLLCTPIHLVTVGFGVAGCALIALATNWPVPLLGLACLLVVVALAGPDRVGLSRRQRLERRRRRTAGLMNPERCPQTSALIGEIAAVVGSPVPKRAEIDPDFNAFASRAGRRHVLTFGAPLWLALQREERLAILGHELGHFAHGDLLSLRYVGIAHESLHRWIDILEPDPGADFAPIFAVLTWPVRVLLTGYARLIEMAVGPSHRRQEHYADLASLVVAGRDASVGAMEVVLAAEGVEVTIDRARNVGEDVVEAIERYRRGFDQERRAGVRRRGDVEASRIDASHPPTMERIRLLESLGDATPAVTRSESEWAAIEKEWAAAVAGAFRDR